jgi:hypothetical protein
MSDAGVVAHFEAEATKAERHKAAIADILKPLAAACEAARRDGFYPEFNVSMNQFGMYVASPVGLIKRF